MTSTVYGISTNKARVAVVRALPPVVQIKNQQLLTEDLNPTLLKFNRFWELVETIEKHGYLRAAMSVVGRSTVGTWWTLRRHPEYGKNAPERHRKRLFAFYSMKTKSWDNIKDYYTTAYKLMIGAMYLRYFGQASYKIVRDSSGAPSGLDFLHGMVVPNVNDTGRFKSPAFVQFLSRDPRKRVEHESPRDIVYLVNPDWEGSPLGGTDIESLTTFALPLDIYLQVAARDYMKNRDKPEVVYSLPSDISEEGFDAFVSEMQARLSGAANMGRNPIAVQGEFSVHELRDLPDSLPYQESRKETREEALAVSGVSGAKLGISASLSSANLREMRREFHETTMLPLFRFIENAFYEQIHVREFGFDGWEFAFNSPDFLTAVERATVHMRYKQMGVLNSNEIRFDLGKPKRTDPGGEMYDGKSGSKPDDPDMPPGSPPEGREDEPDRPSETGEPTLDDQDPPRGDQHNDQPRESILRELRLWRNMVVRRLKRKKGVRKYNTTTIPEELVHIIEEAMGDSPTVSDVELVFDTVLSEVEKEM